MTASTTFLAALSLFLFGSGVLQRHLLHLPRRHRHQHLLGDLHRRPGLLLVAQGRPEARRGPRRRGPEVRVDGFQQGVAVSRRGHALDPHAAPGRRGRGAGPARGVGRVLAELLLRAACASRGAGGFPPARPGRAGGPLPASQPGAGRRPAARRDRRGARRSSSWATTMWTGSAARPSSSRCCGASASNPRFVVPRRSEDGYGLSRSAIDRALEQGKPGPVHRPRLRHQFPRGGGLSPRPGHRRDRHRPPPVEGAGARGRAPHQPARRSGERRLPPPLHRRAWCSS